VRDDATGNITNKMHVRMRFLERDGEEKRESKRDRETETETEREREKERERETEREWSTMQEKETDRK